MSSPEANPNNLATAPSPSTGVFDPGAGSGMVLAVIFATLLFGYLGGYFAAVGIDTIRGKTHDHAHHEDHHKDKHGAPDHHDQHSDKSHADPKHQDHDPDPHHDHGHPEKKTAESSSNVMNSAGRSHATPDKHSQPAQIPVRFQNWPANPKLVLVLSGQLYGYLRPCGCTEGQLGGLARRGALLNQMRQERGWSVLALDAGNLIQPADSQQASRQVAAELNDIRYGYAVQSLLVMDYAAIGVGAFDTLLRMDHLLGEYLNLTPSPMVLGNLQDVDEADQSILKDFAPTVRLLEQDGIKVGFATLLAPEADSTIQRNGGQLLAWEKAVPLILESMQTQQVELKILALQVHREEAISFIQQYPHFDVILCRSRGDALASDTTMVQKTLLTAVGTMGKTVGVVGYYPDRQPRFEFELVSLTPDLGSNPAVEQLYASYVDRLKIENRAERTGRLPTPDGREFVGAETCGQCHKMAYKKWSTTKHAHALETLVQVEPSGQHFNPECLVCHTTGFRQRSGFVTIDKTPKLGGNQCENCHGPGSKHAANPANPDFRVQMRVTRDYAAKTLCASCHDFENDPHFDFETYWPKIEHPWRR